MRRILPALLFAALLQTPQVMAQSSQTGVLSGIVRNAAGGALAGATVTVASKTLGIGTSDGDVLTAPDVTDSRLSHRGVPRDGDAR